MFGDTLAKSNDELIQKLMGWYEKVPDYHDVDAAYKRLGELKSKITRIKREIERIEDQISVEIDKPRSNEAKQRKLAATITLKDQQAELQAELDIQETVVKSLEFHKTMFQAATYAIKMKFDL